MFVRHSLYDDLAEGVSTSAALMLLSEKYGVELPICEAVYEIIYRKKDPEQVLGGLFMRSLKTSSD